MLIHAATDNDIYPPRFGAAQRTFGLARGLARHHQVRVLCLVPNRSRGASEERADGVTLIRRRAWYTSLTWRLEQLRVAPLFAAAWMHGARARSLRDELSGDPDVLAADLHLAGLLRGSRAALKVHTSHNVEYDHFRHAGPAVMAREGWASRRRDLEAAAVATADLTVVCADEDAERMQALYSVAAEKLLVIPNGYDETRVRPATIEERRRARARLGIADADYVSVFLGSDVPHNRAALRVLLEQAMPQVAVPGFKLLVVGSVTQALPASRPFCLIAREETAEIEPLMAAADVGLNPVVAGGGSNVKVPTYMAAGLAVVSTAFGLRGYARLAPWVTVAEPAGFADALRARPTGWAARGLPRPAEVADFAWGRLGERLGEAFEARLHGPAPAREGLHA